MDFLEKKLNVRLCESVGTCAWRLHRYLYQTGPQESFVPNSLFCKKDKKGPSQLVNFNFFLFLFLIFPGLFLSQKEAPFRAHISFGLGS